MAASTTPVLNPTFNTTFSAYQPYNPSNIISQPPFHSLPGHSGLSQPSHQIVSSQNYSHMPPLRVSVI